MSFFKRKDKPLIPPVAPEPPRDSPSRSYNNSPQPLPRSPYDSKSPQPSYDSRYTPSNNANDRYGQGGGNSDENRAALFAGYKPSERPGRLFDQDPQGPARLPEPAAGEENEEDVEGIKQSMRFTKQESVNSTRNALRLAREAEETARNTLGRLGDQSEKLANTERHLDVSKGHSLRAEDKTDELKQLNRSIFRPVISFNKDAKRAAQESKIQQRYEDERMERESTMSDIRGTQDRLGQAQSYGYGEDQRGRVRTGAEQDIRKEQRKRFQFDATASDDELEDELDDNLGEISDMTKRLKALGTAMGQELDNQNVRIGRIIGKTDGLDVKIQNNTNKLSRIK